MDELVKAFPNGESFDHWKEKRPFSQKVSPETHFLAGWRSSQIIKMWGRVPGVGVNLQVGREVFNMDWLDNLELKNEQGDGDERSPEKEEERKRKHNQGGGIQAAKHKYMYHM